MENQSEGARIDGEDPVLLHTSRQRKIIPWPGQGEGDGKLAEWILLRDI